MAWWVQNWVWKELSLLDVEDLLLAKLETLRHSPRSQRLSGVSLFLVSWNAEPCKACGRGPRHGHRPGVLEEALGGGGLGPSCKHPWLLNGNPKLWSVMARGKRKCALVGTFLSYIFAFLTETWTTESCKASYPKHKGKKRLGKNNITK